MPSLPANGVRVITEGALVRIHFDFEQAVPAAADNGEEAPADLYNCESVDIYSRRKGDIIAAIVSERYSSDQVQAVIANYEEAKDPEAEISAEKREEHLSEYAAFQAWRKRAKEVAAMVIAEIA